MTFLEKNSTPCIDAQLAELETVATQHCSRAEQKVCYIRDWNAKCAKHTFVLYIINKYRREEMQKYCELKEDCLMVYVPRELDHHEANQLKQEADLMIQAYHVKRLIFDFTGTEFMDSSGIGVIIGRCRNMSYCGGSVSAQNLNGRLKKIFMVSGLHKLIETSRTE